MMSNPRRGGGLNRTVWRSCWRCCIGGGADGRSGRFRQRGRRVKSRNQRRSGATAGDGLQPARSPAAAGPGGLWRSGAGGEIRPVPSGQAYLEAAKHGFRRAIVPAANVPKKVPEGANLWCEKAFRRAKRFDDL